MDRRTFVKGVGVAGAASMVAGRAAAAGVSTGTIDSKFEMDGGLQESLVVFRYAGEAYQLEELDLAKGYRVFENLAIAHTFLDPAQIETVAGWDSVLRVKRSEKLEYLNDDRSRESMNVDPVHDHKTGHEKSSGNDTAPDLSNSYLGDDVHVVLIDSGLDGSHPAFQGRVEANYRYVDRPLGARDPLWVDVGSTPNDEVGHGTHCSGIALGNGAGAASGDYHGMAPKATITAYNTTQAVYLPYAVAAWNHMLGRIQDPTDDFDPDVVTNSYGVARGTEYNPFDPVNVASWRAFQEGLFIAWAMGNDGNLGTGNRFGKAPHILPVAAAKKTMNNEDNRKDRPITGFSSRGRAYNPAKADEKPSKYISDKVYYNRETLIGNLRDYWALANGDTRPVSSDTRSGAVGPAANGTFGFVNEETSSATAYEQFTAKGNADVVTLDLSFQPEGQWVRVRVYERRGEDNYRQVAAAREEPVKLHTDLTFDVDAGTEYLIQFKSEDAVYAEYEVTIEQSARPEGELGDQRPISLYRPGVSTHGSSVMSTIQPGSVLGPLAIESAAVDRNVIGAAINGNPSAAHLSVDDPEGMYGRLSGTSMATPAAAGIGAVCIQAYRENHPDGDSPDPIDIIRIMESTARDLNPNYNVHNTGAGYVDAASAVKAAEDLATGDLTVAELETGLDALVKPPAVDKPPKTVNLSVTGTRSDDARLFTGGQTDKVELTVKSISPDRLDGVYVIDSVPASWTVKRAYGDVVRVTEKNGRKQVHFGKVPPGASVTYFVEAPSGPSATGSYTFGPATAKTNEELSGDGSQETTFGGTDTNYVAGPSTNV